VIEIIRGGMLTTIQDQGRYGYQRYGIPRSGPMDWFAARLANILVGNTAADTFIESTIMGPTVHFIDECLFALTGATFPAELDHDPVEMNTSVLAPAGSHLVMGTATQGARGYLAFSGGLVVEPSLGSTSTYTKAGLGGVDGRALIGGDRIEVGATTLPRYGDRRSAPWNILPPYSDAPTVRFTSEKRADRFDDRALEVITSHPYTITAESDRMGYRLDGVPIPYAERCDGNIISEGIPLGSIQVIDHRPVVLMADRQTIGGYAKLGAVIKADIPLLAQLKPGNSVRFSDVTVNEAQRVFRKMQGDLVLFDRALSNAHH